MGVEYGVQLCYGFGGQGSGEDIVKFFADRASEDLIAGLMAKCNVTEPEDIYAEYLTELVAPAGYPTVGLLTGGTGWSGKGYWFLHLVGTDTWVNSRESENLHLVLKEPSEDVSELLRLRDELRLDEETYPLAWQFWGEAT